MVIGTPNAEIDARCRPVDGDFTCSRRSGVAMWYGTDLDAMLCNCAVDSLAMTGVSTNLALFGGSLDAVDRGYQVVIAEDATAGGAAETHQWMIRNALPLLATMTTTDIVVDAITAHGVQ